MVQATLRWYHPCMWSSNLTFDRCSLILCRNKLPKTPLPRLSLFCVHPCIFMGLYTLCTCYLCTMSAIHSVSQAIQSVWWMLWDILQKWYNERFRIVERPGWSTLVRYELQPLAVLSRRGLRESSNWPWSRQVAVFWLDGSSSCCLRPSWNRNQVAACLQIQSFEWHSIPHLLQLY